ncbi:MAG: hypothetical protein JWM25_1678 [Thermoleophilia bacterium]|nr:hypothetical protein [Thermoleophilia bacterium]MCZ4497093.1 hypothetical protein [Thermoleophilia bacterium]
MENDHVVTMIQGANVLACLAIAAFFLRSWRTTHDTFFLLFSLAFGMFAVNRCALAFVDERDEALSLYLVRLAAFLMIATAIVLKNRTRSRGLHDAG